MKQTICVNLTPGDATREAERVAANMRDAGFTVTIGKEYTLGLGHKAGMLAVDLFAEPGGVIALPEVTTATTVDAVPAFLTIDATDEEGNVLDDAGELVTNPNNPRRHPPRQKKRQEVPSGGRL